MGAPPSRVLPTSVSARHRRRPPCDILETDGVTRKETPHRSRGPARRRRPLPRLGPPVQVRGSGPRGPAPGRPRPVRVRAARAGGGRLLLGDRPRRAPRHAVPVPAGRGRALPRSRVALPAGRPPRAVPGRGSTPVPLARRGVDGRATPGAGPVRAARGDVHPRGQLGGRAPPAPGPGAP